MNWTLHCLYQINSNVPKLPDSPNNTCSMVKTVLFLTLWFFLCFKKKKKILSSGYSHHIFYSGIVYIIWETSYCIFIFSQASQDFPKFQAFYLSLTLHRFSHSCSRTTEGLRPEHSYEKKHPIISGQVRILASPLTSCLTGASYIIT